MCYDAFGVFGAILRAPGWKMPFLFLESGPDSSKRTAGRMIQTIYPESYQDEVSIFDFAMRPGPSTFARPDCTTKTGCKMGADSPRR